MGLCSCLMPAMQDKADSANPQEDITMRQEYPTEEIPNTETISSIAELDSGGGTLFTGSTDDLFAELTDLSDTLLFNRV